jgi:hypothetical protein
VFLGDTDLVYEPQTPYFMLHRLKHAKVEIPYGKTFVKGIRDNLLCPDPVGRKQRLQIRHGNL